MLTKTLSTDQRGLTVVLRQAGGVVRLHSPKYSPVMRVELIDATVPTTKVLVAECVKYAKSDPSKTYLKARSDVFSPACAKRLGFKSQPDGDYALSLF